VVFVPIGRSLLANLCSYDPVGGAVPTSVLLAVLTAAGLLALAPALTRRSDPPVPAVSTSTARVLSRRRRRRTVPGARPVRPPRVRHTTRAEPTRTSRTAARTDPAQAGRATGRTGTDAPRAQPRRKLRRRVLAPAARRVPAKATHPVRRRRPAPTALHRRRRVFVALILLNLVELAGVLLVGPGFWIGFSVAFVVLLADIVYLRRRAVVVARRRRAMRRRQAWIAAQQAAIRREHERRAAQRAAAARRVAQARQDARRLAIPRTEHYPRRAQ
jgi:hypothetical protein